MADVNGSSEEVGHTKIKTEESDLTKIKTEESDLTKIKTEESDVKTEANGDSKNTEETPNIEETPNTDGAITEDVKPVIKLDPEIRAKKIKRQIEYYFGDFNLPTDKFLRDEVKKNEGWIPLETMIKFKRLAALTTDPAVILEALQGSQLIQISEDKTQIRRNPDKPLPEENEARRKEILSRTVYVKGFPQEGFTIDNALDYFEEIGPTDDVVMRFWQDKATKTWKFKGSVFVKFPSREAAAAFLAREEVKFGDQVLVRMFQEEYIDKKRKERLEQKMLKRKRPETEVEGKEERKPAEERGLPKDATLHMTGVPEGLAREAVKERLEEMGVSVAFIDYNKGDAEGWIRLHEAGTAANEFNESSTEQPIDLNQEEECDQDLGIEIPASANGSTPFNLQPYETAMKKPKLQNNEMQAMIKQMTVVGEKLANKQTVRDEFTTFGEYVANELRKCNGKKYALILADAKFKMTSALHEAEMERIRMDNSPSPSSDPQNRGTTLNDTPTYFIVDTSNTSDSDATTIISQFNANI